MAARIDAGRGGLRSPATGGVQIRGGGAGNAMEGLGRAIQGFAQPLLEDAKAEREADQQNADRMALAKAGSEARLAWQKRLNDAIDNYDGSSDGFADEVAGAFEEDVRARVGSVSQRIRPALQEDLLRLGERTTSAAIEAERGKRQAYVMGGLRETVDATATSLLEDPQDLGGAFETIERLAEAAPAGLREKFRAEAKLSVSSAYADGLLKTDPGRLHYELEAGYFDDVLDAKQKAAMVANVDGQIARQAAALKREQDAQAKEATATAKDLAARVKAYESAGLPAPAELLQAAIDAAAAAHEPGLIEGMQLASYKRRNKGASGGTKSAKEALKVLEGTLDAGLQPSADMIAAARAEVEAAGSEDLYQQLKEIADTQALRSEAAFQPRAELDARIDTLRANPADKAAFREYTVLSKVASQRDKRGRTDNIGWAEANGVVFQPVALGTDSLTGDMARRVIQAEAQASQSGEPLQLFSAKERKKLANDLAAMAPEEQAIALAQLTVGAGSRAGVVIRELAEKQPAFGQVGYLTATQRGDTALEALQGLALVKARPELLPTSKATLSGVETSTLGTAIPDARGDVRAGVIAAARGIYAGRLAAAGKTAKDFDPDDYAEALQDAAGRRGATGGIGKVNGQLVQLPAQMRAGEVRDLLRGMGEADWTAFSLNSKSVPSALGADGMEALTPEELKNAYLVSVGEGRYHVSLTNPRNGASYVLDSESDPEAPRPFVLDLTDVDPATVLQRLNSEAALKRAARQRETFDPASGQYAPAYKDYLARSGDRPIDTGRPILENPDGTFSTEETITLERDGKWYNVPTIINGQRVDPAEVEQLFLAGKVNEVGKYDTLKQAEAAAVARSKEIGRVRGEDRSGG